MFLQWTVVSLKWSHDNLSKKFRGWALKLLEWLLRCCIFEICQEHKITECSIHDLLHWMHYEYDPGLDSEARGVTQWSPCCLSWIVLSRESLCQICQAEDKKSKLWSLPETLFLFAAFVISVVLHLNVWEAFKSSRVYTVAMTYGALAGVEIFFLPALRGKLPTCQQHEADICSKKAVQWFTY